jgi:hypothetical protein
MSPVWKNREENTQKKLFRIGGLGTEIRTQTAQWYSAGLRAGWSGVWVSTKAGNFLFTTASRTALGSSQPPIQWVLGALSLSVKLTTHLYLVPRLRMSGAIPPLPQCAFMAWCSLPEYKAGEMSYRPPRLVTTQDNEYGTSDPQLLYGTIHAVSMHGLKTKPHFFVRIAGLRLGFNPDTSLMRFMRVIAVHFAFVLQIILFLCLRSKSICSLYDQHRTV